MSDPDALDERLRAVERALTESDDDLTDLRDAAELTREVESLSARLDEVEACLDELDAATQALRGYVGNVRAVNQSVERRADAALAKAEALEADRRGCGADESEGYESDGNGPNPVESGDKSARSVEADENGPHPAEADDRATESDRNPPCGCRSRRRSRSRVADERDATAGTDRRDRSEQSRDRGLLARIAEAL